MPVPPQADATSTAQPPAAGGAVPKGTEVQQLQQMLNSAVENMQTAVWRLTSGTPPGAIAGNDLRHLLNAYVDLQDTARQLATELQQLEPVEGSGMTVAHGIDKLQAEVERWIGAVEGELRGADVRPVGPLTQTAPLGIVTPPSKGLSPTLRWGILVVGGAALGYYGYKVFRRRRAIAAR